MSVAPAARRDRLFIPWVLLAGACVLWMWLVPGGEVIPFHLIWIGFALAYGFEPWPVPRSVVALGVATAASGAVLIHRARAGVIAWEETAEIALMVLLAALVMGHVRRRQVAMAHVTDLAGRMVATARERERLARLTSHEMRTPLTIASGYVDLLLAGEDRPDRRADLEVVRDELGRLARAGDRLLRMIRLRDVLARSQVDLETLVHETVERWATVADRNWVVQTTSCTLEASAERLRVCLDTLIENAVRYTDEGGTVRVFCFRRGDARWLGVADSGRGFTADQVAALHEPPRPPTALDEPNLRAGVGGQTGFGLGMVREIVEARDGVVLAGRSREGGALVVVLLRPSPHITAYRR